MNKIDCIKSALNELMDEHVGRDRAITSAALCELVGEMANPGGEPVDDRSLREALKGMLEEDGVLIVSATEKPRGFFIAADNEEALEYAEHLAGRARSIIRRAIAVYRILERMGYTPGECADNAVGLLDTLLESKYVRRPARYEVGI